MRLISEHGGEREDTGATGGRLMRTIRLGQVKGAFLFSLFFEEEEERK